MRAARLRLVILALTCIGTTLVRPTGAAGGTLAAPPRTHFVYLPFVCRPAPSVCPTSSANQYGSLLAMQYDLENPVRPAEVHADKNLDVRSYTPSTDPALVRSLVNFGTDDPKQPPQFASLFSPYRVPPLSGFYRVYDWNWAASPDPGTRGAPLSTWPVTALGLQTTPGEALHVPTSAYDIGGGMEVLILYADEDTITLRYTREDSSASQGYTVHLDNICTDPNLLALYRSLDCCQRYEFHGRGWWGYNLPALPAGKVLGTARGTEIVVAIQDTGNFMDPRSCNEWWQLRPGYTGSCPGYNGH
ncbi:MAG: hypothetical protein QME94_14375 [Anaerolineae bacterium]|nr:hypothetical protein [Anaerolineae bacterium]